MNEPTLLKILVERVVRPVRASTSRKCKMRQELLAHVSAVFEEELKLDDATAALERTAQRFGAPAELTRQLQDTVPSSDRVVYWMDSFFSEPIGEPALRRALRFAVFVGTACAFLLAIMILIIGPWNDWLALYRLPSLFAPVFMAVLTFFGTLLTLGMRQAMYGPGGRSLPRMLAIGVASWLLIPGVTFLSCYAFSGGSILSTLLDVAILFLTGLLCPTAMIPTIWFADAEIRHLEEWASLKIDAEAGV